METLIVSVVLAAVTGLAVLAYRHPYAYKIIGPCIMGLLAVWFGQAILYGYGGMRAEIRSNRKYAEEQPDTPMGTFVRSFREAEENAQTLNKSVLILVGAELYLALLLALPALIDHDNTERARRQKIDKLASEVRQLQDEIQQHKPVKPAKDKEKVKPTG